MAVILTFEVILVWTGRLGNKGLQPLFPLHPREADQEKQNSVHGGDGRGKANQGQAGIGKRRHEQSDRNTDQEGGADSLNHDG